MIKFLKIVRIFSDNGRGVKVLGVVVGTRDAERSVVRGVPAKERPVVDEGQVARSIPVPCCQSVPGREGVLEEDGRDWVALW